MSGPAGSAPEGEASAASEEAPEAAATESAQAEQRREPVFNVPAIVIAFIAICAAIHLVRVYLLTDEQNLTLLVYAAFFPIRYSGQFDLDIFAFTSTVSYSLLHGSVAHLAINMVWLAAFGTPLANRIGAVKFCLFWLLTAFAAAALHYVVHMDGQAPLVGASGAISGMMGAATRFAFRIGRTDGKSAFMGTPLPVLECLRYRTVVTFLAVWMAVNLVTGLVGLGAAGDASIAWEAHIGGFLAGFFGVTYFVGRPERAQAEQEPTPPAEEPADQA
ncbi:MAG TPA: rhomboid family intramembrane serine protease [Rhizobiaceae bacterium]|nr:rhomboid family intramembrane serine protease [Rhizobiaceae bacterium]